jgi:hypothetical protein
MASAQAPGRTLCQHGLATEKFLSGRCPTRRGDYLLFHPLDDSSQRIQGGVCADRRTLWEGDGSG